MFINMFEAVCSIVGKFHNIRLLTQFIMTFSILFPDTRWNCFRSKIFGCFWTVFRILLFKCYKAISRSQMVSFFFKFYKLCILIRHLIVNYHPTIRKIGLMTLINFDLLHIVYTAHRFISSLRRRENITSFFFDFRG